MTDQMTVRHVLIAFFLLLLAVNIPIVINLMANATVLRDMGEMIVYHLCVDLWQMERTDRCGKATTANVKTDGRASTATSAQKIKLVMP
jgi:hypothetical protein